MDHIENALTSLQEFVNKTMDDLRVSLKQQQPGNSTIGLSFEPDMVLNYVPSVEIIKPGLYDSSDGKVHVEVLRQDPETGLVHLEIYDEEDPYKRFDFASTGMFLRLFKPKSPLAYVTGNRTPSTG